MEVNYSIPIYYPNPSTCLDKASNFFENYFWVDGPIALVTERYNENGHRVDFVELRADQENSHVTLKNFCKYTLVIPIFMAIGKFFCRYFHDIRYDSQEGRAQRAQERSRQYTQRQNTQVRELNELYAQAHPDTQHPRTQVEDLNELHEQAHPVSGIRMISKELFNDEAHIENLPCLEEGITMVDDMTHSIMKRIRGDTHYIYFALHLTLSPEKLAHELSKKSDAEYKKIILADWFKDKDGNYFQNTILYCAITNKTQNLNNIVFSFIPKKYRLKGDIPGYTVKGLELDFPNGLQAITRITQRGIFAVNKDIKFELVRRQ